MLLPNGIINLLLELMEAKAKILKIRSTSEGVLNSENHEVCLLMEAASKRNPACCSVCRLEAQY